MKKRHTTHSASVINARHLRRESTPSENKLWSVLRNRRLAGWKFRRQYPIGRWVLDFFCLERMAAVEIDGTIHDHPNVKEHDVQREIFLRQLGIRTIHITPFQIDNDLSSVLLSMNNFLASLTPSPGVSQERGLGGEEGKYSVPGEGVGG